MIGIHALALVLVAWSPVDPSGTPPEIRCTPNSVRVGLAEPQATRHPIVRALEKARPGSVIYLEPGDYRPFTIGLDSRSPSNARTRGGRPSLPVVIDGRGFVRIIGTTGDAIGIDQKVPNGHITFRNLTIVPGERAGVLFYKQSGGRVHAGYSFEDCHILGNWNHVTRQGKKSKWGIWGHRLQDFRFVGVRRPARVENIRFEHGFYLQNHAGSILIENVEAKYLGRTFCQFTARAADGPPGRGKIIVRNCKVNDVGIAREDDFKGGLAFTVAGRVLGKILFENNHYRAGFDPTLRKLTRKGQPYGTGAFVAWQGGEKTANGSLILRDNVFEFAEGCGDRPVVQIGGCSEVQLLGENRFVSGGKSAALAIDPVDDNGRAISPPNKGFRMDRTTSLLGVLTRAGRKLGPNRIEALYSAREPEQAREKNRK